MGKKLDILMKLEIVEYKLKFQDLDRMEEYLKLEVNQLKFQFEKQFQYHIVQIQIVSKVLFHWNPWA